MIFLVFIFCGCTGRHKIPQDTLVIGIPNEVKNLDVRFTRDKNAWKIIQLISEALLIIGDDGELEPQLAQSYQVSPDYKKITFQLKLPRNFYTGEEIKVSDLIFSYSDANRPGAPLKKWLDEVKRYYFDSEKSQFVIELKKPSPFFIYRVVPLIKILPEKYASRKDFFKNPVGSGPYYFSQKDGRDLILLRNEHYHPQPKYKKIIFRSVSDSSTRFMSLLAQDLDVLFGSLNENKVKALENTDRLRLLKKTGDDLEFIALNLKKEKFQSETLRKTLFAAIPREEIIKYKFQDLAKIANGIFPQQHPYYYKDSTESAQFKNAAFPPAFNIKILTSSDPNTISWLLLLKKSWESLGVSVHIESYEFATFFSMLKKGNYDAFVFRMDAKSDPSFLYDFFHSSQWPPGRNRFYLQDEQVDQILERVMKPIVNEERTLLIQQLQRILQEKQYFFPLWHKEQSVLINSKIKDFDWENSWREIIYSYK